MCTKTYVSMRVSTHVQVNSCDITQSSAVCELIG